MPPTPEYAGRLPAWTRDELILALDLYLRFRPGLPRKNGPEVAELATTLQTMGAGRLNGVPDALRTKFRNPAGVYMKIGNFLRLDSTYTSKGRTGLSRGSRDEEPVWNEFTVDPARCHAVADAIRRAVADGATLPKTDDEGDDGLPLPPEGAILWELHQRRERADDLPRRKRAAHLKKHGRFFCEGCGIDPERAYGAKGHTPLQCHHLRPLHTLVTPTPPTLEEVALLCANCHATVHSERPWLTMPALRARVRMRYDYEGSPPEVP